MKLLIATPLFSFLGDAGHFWVKAFCELQHSVSIWDYRLKEYPPTIDYDACIVLKGESICPSMLHQPRVIYWPDEFVRTPGIEPLLKEYDIVFSSEAPPPAWVHWLPAGWDPDIHRVPENTNRYFESVYIGTANSDYKVRTVMGLRPQIVAGNKWPISGTYRGRMPPQYLRDFVELASSAKVLIDVHPLPNVGLNRKFFELMACGPTIVDRVPGVKEVLGQELHDQVTFSTVEEGQELIRRLLAMSDAERHAIWVREKTAIQPYSYLNCAREMIQCIERL